MIEEHAMDDAAYGVLMVQGAAIKRGNLTIWTIYNRPTDYPHGHIARRFEVGGGETTVTDHSLIGDLEELREVFRRAGLTNICRQEGDEPRVVESWI